MEQLKITVAKNIVSLRTRFKLTQSELGEKLNYSDKAVSRWERADAIPDAYVLMQMANIFGVTVDYLLNEHEENDCEPQPPKKYRINKYSVSLIAFIGVWTAALFIFVILFLLDKIYWMIFTYTLPVSLTVLLVFNSVWGKARHNIYIISGIIWSILLSIYLSFLDMNIWIIFLLGIPAQLITLLCFHIKKRK